MPFVLHTSGLDPGVSDDEGRTITEMIANGNVRGSPFAASPDKPTG